MGDLGSGRSELADLKASWQGEMEDLGILPRRPPSPRSAPARLPARCDERGAARRRSMPMPPLPLPPEPPLLTAHGCGFGTGGRVDELEARWSAMLCARELPLEPASRDPSFEPDVHVTQEEAAALPL